ncbi:MAG: hypothetical protein PVI86_01195 [Phycisphaerae bacterium]|jgi:hypothetical protein
MDPITLATVTSAVSVLATEFAKGAASDAGGDAWKKIKSLFGWKAEPEPAQLAPTAARQLQGDEKLAAEVASMLQAQHTGTPSDLVGNISVKAGKVAVTTVKTVEGDLNISL